MRHTKSPAKSMLNLISRNDVGTISVYGDCFVFERAKIIKLPGGKTYIDSRHTKQKFKIADFDKAIADFMASGYEIHGVWPKKTAEELEEEKRNRELRWQEIQTKNERRLANGGALV